MNNKKITHIINNSIYRILKESKDNDKLLNNMISETNEDTERLVSKIETIQQVMKNMNFIDYDIIESARNAVKFTLLAQESLKDLELRIKL